MASEREKWEHLLSEYPSEICFRGKVLPIISLAITELNATKAAWLAGNYEVAVSVNNDESYAAVSFLPNLFEQTSSLSFDERTHQIEHHPNGMIYVYRLQDHVLVETKYL